MLALARSRRYCFQSIGALGVIEMTAPARAGFVDQGLKRLRIPPRSACISPCTPYWTSNTPNAGTARCCVPWSGGPALRAGDRRRSHASSVAWRAVFRSLSAPLHFEQQLQSGGIGLRGYFEHALLGRRDCADLAALYLRLAEEGQESRCSLAFICPDTLCGLSTRLTNERAELDSVGQRRRRLYLSRCRRGTRRAAGRPARQGCRRDRQQCMGRGSKNDGLRRTGCRRVGVSSADVFEFWTARRGSSSSMIGLPLRREFQRRRRTDFCRPSSRRQRCASCACLRGRPGGRKLHSHGLHRRDRNGSRRLFQRRRFLEPACLDWEHKRFFPGDLGELTGEMGTVVTYSRHERFFDRTLGRWLLCSARTAIAAISTSTPSSTQRASGRSNSPAVSAIPAMRYLEPLQEHAVGRALQGDAEPLDASFETEPGFAVGIVVTTPPFPYLPRHGTRACRTCRFVDGRTVFRPVATKASALWRGSFEEARGTIRHERDRTDTTLVATGVGETVEAACADRRRMRWPTKSSCPMERYSTRHRHAFNRRRLCPARSSGSARTRRNMARGRAAARSRSSPLYAPFRLFVVPTVASPWHTRSLSIRRVAAV